MLFQILLLLLSTSLLLLPLVAAASPQSSTSINNNTNKTFFITNPQLPPRLFWGSSKRFEGSSKLVKLRYHMGPVLSSSPINIYLIWYGKWEDPSQKDLIKDFILSINDDQSASPSVSEWWRTASLYTDQTGANISHSIHLAGEHSDNNYSQGTHLTRLSIQNVISTAIGLFESNKSSSSSTMMMRNGVYLVLTSTDVTVQDFCRAVCGFHYFTFPSIVGGYTLPYAWVGNSAKQCPEVCAYPFAIPGYIGSGARKALLLLRPPNDDVGLDSMISVIGHELAELASNPLVNAWYAGDDPTAPTEIGDLCQGPYGTGGGGGYIGQVRMTTNHQTYNLNGRNGRKFLVQWIWSPILNACAGPNALD